MFTPPPSPLPKQHLIPPFPEIKPEADEPARPRRRRYIALLIPAVILGVIAMTARHHTLQAVSSRFPITEPIAAHLDANFVGRGPAHKRGHGHDDVLHRRQSQPVLDLTAPGTLTPTPTTGNAASSTGGGLTASASLPVYTAAPAIPSPALPIPTPFPAPFDISLSFNITTPSCISFFNTFVQNITFRACRPFGLLASSSQQFQLDQSNLTTLTAVMGGTCNTDMSADDCGAVMDWHASQIAMDENCGPDIAAKEALAVTALTGFRSYRMMRQAGCLVNPVTRAYCYVEAVASLLPNDLYFWNIALGTALPNSTMPTCSSCTESLLSTYAQFAGNQSLPVSGTYEGAARKARDACGTGYAKDLTAASSAVAVRLPSLGLGGSALLALALSVLGLLLLEV